jgi:hypothetical protein
MKFTSIRWNDCVNNNTRHKWLRFSSSSSSSSTMLEVLTGRQRMVPQLGIRINKADINKAEVECLGDAEEEEEWVNYSH